ncbi:hypothetical protein DCAR_0520923 [Daucus carota subsp. sativus]|uniref:Uncharacterized protein n=1 Tax=Daucus carota subsp. sativus TaxID=79200 RepID=A0A164YYD3_DAUCS|nr:PREDICTED: uncharacterized protein LOC108221624 [Daucus carota subsp. sativus]WOH01539.1 hypothetical protein DCAR_0520923 [Daucus carota subsp. sativus]
MGFSRWQQNEKTIFGSETLIRQCFQILTTTLLSLLLPLSFLLVARLTTARYLLDYDSSSTSQPLSTLFSLFLATNPTLLHGLVSVVCFLSLVHGLSKERVMIAPSSEPSEPILRPRLYTAWIILCTLQVLVGVGIEGSIGSGADVFNFGYERGVLSKFLFFVGLHETMLYWSRMVVKPVVDDTVFGSTREERWIERMILAASFSTLWWWRLNDEVVSLVVVAEVKKELLTATNLADFVSWWLYYLTVTIGIVRLIRSFIWVGFVLFSSKPDKIADDSCGNDQKV